MKVYSISLVLGLLVLLSSCSLQNTDPYQAAVVQFTKDTVAIRSYLVQNKINATGFLNQGVWFIIDSLGKGIRATYTDSIKIKYSTLLMADNSLAQQGTELITVNQLVVGSQVALSQFPAGSKGRIFIPFSQVNKGIGADKLTAANLIFNFKLLSVKDHQLEADTVIIDKYLSDKSIKAIKDVSGLRYTINTMGTGERPKITNYVSVVYTLTVMKNGIVVNQSVSSKFLLSSLILGWQIGLANVPSGSTVTLYVPSSLAYGSFAQTNIPANSNLIFDIQLVSVTTI